MATKANPSSSTSSINSNNKIRKDAELLKKIKDNNGYLDGIKNDLSKDIDVVK
jgi:hypothetical protein